MKYDNTKIVALCGGIGGSKLALGVNNILKQKNLSIITNTGDDFLYLGFYICPDIDTVIYTLAGVNNPETGWGREDETWKTLDVLKELGSRHLVSTWRQRSGIASLSFKRKKKGRAFDDNNKKDQQKIWSQYQCFTNEQSHGTNHLGNIRR